MIILYTKGSQIFYCTTHFENYLKFGDPQYNYYSAIIILLKYVKIYETDRLLNDCNAKLQYL